MDFVLQVTDMLSPTANDPEMTRHWCKSPLWMLTAYELFKTTNTLPPWMERALRAEVAGFPKLAAPPAKRRRITSSSSLYPRPSTVPHLPLKPTTIVSARPRPTPSSSKMILETIEEQRQRLQMEGIELCDDEPHFHM
jgi:hypothetical protein